MPRLSLLFLAAILTMAGCAPGDDEEEIGDESAAQTDGDAAPLKAGDKLKTTVKLRLREGPSREATIRLVMPRGAEVTVRDPEVKDGYIKVMYVDPNEEDETKREKEGFAFRSYLRDPASVSTTTTAPTGTSGTCKASWYGPGFDGRTTANGETFDQDAMTAARQLAFKSVFPFSPKGKPTVRVTNLANNQFVDVRITDTGPLRPGRCLDLSKGAFDKIADLGTGVINVKYEPVPEESVGAQKGAL
jgi:rare lipoprotein A